MRSVWKPFGNWGLLALGALLTAALAAGCAQPSRAASPTEVVQASYLDLTGNITDLRSRVAEWQKGDEGSLNIAGEKLERIETVLAAAGWPREMEAAIARTRAAVDPMDMALKAHDIAAAEAAAKEFGEASHDVIHAYYGDWLPHLEHSQVGSMAAHVNYLDLNANVADLQSRVAQWQKGDDGSLNIAREKAERMEVLVQHMAPSGVFARQTRAIEVSLPAMVEALERADVGAAQQALKPIEDAGRNLTRDAYLWMDIVAGAEDPACVQASYLDLSRNLSELRSAVAAWQKGDVGSPTMAKERLARAETLVAHVAWPESMMDAIVKTETPLEGMAGAIEAQDLAMAGSTSEELADASHDVTHAYYGDWLPVAPLAGAKTQTRGAQSRSTSGAHADSHGAEQARGHSAPVAEEGPNWLIIGGFVGALALVVITAAVTKPKGLHLSGILLC